MTQLAGVRVRPRACKSEHGSPFLGGLVTAPALTAGTACHPRQGPTGRTPSSFLGLPPRESAPLRQEGRPSGLSSTNPTHRPPPGLLLPDALHGDRKRQPLLLAAGPLGGRQWSGVCPLAHQPVCLHNGMTPFPPGPPSSRSLLRTGRLQGGFVLAPGH